jgi:hypothetical protein
MRLKNYGNIKLMSFKFNNLNAQCMWCKRKSNPHPDYKNESIPTKIFFSEKGRKIELCFSCYENEKFKTETSKFKKKLDLKFETMILLKL